MISPQLDPLAPFPYRVGASISISISISIIISNMALHLPEAGSIRRDGFILMEPEMLTQ
jgi:hypothetical protein